MDIATLGHLIVPEPIDQQPMTHEQLHAACQSMLPDTARVQVDAIIATGHRGPCRSVDVFITLDDSDPDSREMHVEAQTCEEALQGVRRGMEQLRFGTGDVRVSA